MNKKYELFKEKETDELYRIRALRDFSDVEKGDVGGFVASENNLSHYGDCWVYDNGVVCDDAVVRDNTMVYDNVRVCGHSVVCENAIVREHSVVCDNAIVREHSVVCGHSTISECSVVSGRVKIFTGKIENSSQYIVFENVGSRRDNLTVFISENEIYCSVGCFSGTLKEFEKAVEEKHKGTKYEKEYKTLIETAKKIFECRK